MIRHLCHYRDFCDPHVLTATKIVKFIEYSLNTKNICSNMPLSLYTKCCIVLL